MDRAQNLPSQEGLPILKSDPVDSNCRFEPHGSVCGPSVPCRFPWHHGLCVVRRGCLRGALLSALPQCVPGHPVQVWLVLLAWHGGVSWLLLVWLPAHLLHVSLQRWGSTAEAQLRDRAVAKGVLQVHRVGKVLCHGCSSPVVIFSAVKWE